MKYLKQNFIEKLFNWKVPYALPIEMFSDAGNYTWEKWEKETKEKYPVKYFLLRTIPSIFDNIYSIFKNFKYKYTSLYWKKQHLLDIRYPKLGYEYGYCDPCTKILIVNMKILSDFIEEYDIVADIENNRQDLPQRSVALEKAIEIYNWWKSFNYDFNEDYPEDRSKRKEWAERYTLFEKQKEDEISTRLKELINIRQYLWS